MGGHALKNTNCVRINKKLYEEIKNDILSKLMAYFYVGIIPEPPEKESFGDLDILYRADSRTNMNQTIVQMFNPKEFFVNGNVISFSYKINENEYFQIDLIKVDNYEMAKFYFSYGDVGNILGRTVKPHNLTLGHEGLWTNYENEKIILYDDPESICKFLGLNYDVYKKGFKTKIDMFNWLMKCKYHRNEYFKFENLNYQYRHRYNTRPLFTEFVNYINSYNIKNDELVKETPLEYIIKCNKQKEKEEIDKKIFVRKLHQEKFSGIVFANYIPHKYINEYKSEFVKFISQYSDFNTWLQNNDISVINNEIKNFCLNKKNNYIIN